MPPGVRGSLIENLVYSKGVSDVFAITPYLE